MNKVILSTFLLIASVVVVFLLGYAVFRNHPTFGEFYNLLYFGLVVFMGCLGVFASGLLLEKSVKEMQD